MLNLNTRHETIKLEENTGKKFSDINCSSASLGQSPKAKEIKAKINKWNLIKVINCSTAKQGKPETKQKHNLQKWKKIFANDVTDKGLLSKICKQLIQLNNKVKQPNNNQNKVGRRPK